MARRILVLHGPNLNLLGRREPHIYGASTLAEVDAALHALGTELGVELDCRQSNHEGTLIDWLQEANDAHQGVLLNAGGYTHTSVAIRDAIAAIDPPCVEVHVSNVHAREPFRAQSHIAPACLGTISGFGAGSYTLGLRALIDYLDSADSRG